MPILHEIAAEAVPSIELDIWSERLNANQVKLTSLAGLSSLDRDYLRSCVPIGSVEFTEKVMELGWECTRGIIPINIPFDMSSCSLWKRRMAYACGEDGVRSVFDDWEEERLFIKSADRVKAPFTGIYKRDDPAEPYKDEQRLLVSTVLPLETDQCSEWRIFVKSHEFVDMKCYSGNPWVLPDKKTVEQVISNLPKNRRAYTADVAVTDKGETVIIELHNFVACGAYGAELPLSMYRYGYLDELKQHGKNFFLEDTDAV